ncbi:DNA repair protein RecN [Collinsella sp. AGMB00827]|uniref:DNA repair protein RecN n=1 Tax=Collinsella ureilytica TaxID=2869515 RepID=A0ABS7ML41_9ACTN|nr:DNA repair protein RecN [Collinsella urealyticum]
MIDEISVANLALIKEAHLNLEPGLTVLTGETGAGKSALLSALKLLMGERGDASQVRDGSDEAQVQGRFFIGSDDLDGITVSRRIGTDGRSRVRINGELAGVRELASLMEPVIDLCGQHEHQRLLDPTNHLYMVDMWGHSVISERLRRYQEAFAHAKEAAAELCRIESASRAQGERVDQARFVLDRIQEVEPKPGELEQLEEMLPVAEHAQALATTANDAYGKLSGEDGALDALHEALSELERMTSVDARLTEMVDTLSEAAISLEDGASDLRRYRDEIDFDPARLAQLQERHAALRGLMRAFGPSMDDVFAAQTASEELISLVDAGEERVRAAQDEAKAAEAELVDAARELKAARDRIAPRFCREVMAQMALLEMGGAELVWQSRELERAAWQESGSCACEFLYRSAPGLVPRPLRRIASGGELSRMLLAAKVVLGSADATETLVFDEVDAGVGGSAARALAALLERLSKTHQVIVVTHVAAVAAVADCHYVVRRTGTDEPRTELVLVKGNERVRELARMLSGDDSEVSLAHARELMAEHGR